MFDAIINRYAAAFGVPALWIKAVIATESNGNPRAFRAEPQINDASYGLMQLLTKTAKGLGYTGSAEGLYDPDANIRLGTKLLRDLRARYGDDFRRVYSAYNSGRPDLWETSSQVAANVSRAVHWLEKYIQEEPAIATAGSAGALVIALLAFAWLRKKGKS